MMDFAVKKGRAVNPELNTVSAENIAVIRNP